MKTILMNVFPSDRRKRVGERPSPAEMFSVSFELILSRAEKEIKDLSLPVMVISRS